MRGDESSRRPSAPALGLLVGALALASACRGGEAPEEPASERRAPVDHFAIVGDGGAGARTPVAQGDATAPEGAEAEATTSGEEATAASVDAEEPALDYDPAAWLEVQALDATVTLDIRYATTDNFVGEALYPCGRCFLRPEAAKAVIEAHRALREAGYGGLKLFDCYRPRPVQEKLWAIHPDPAAVAPPARGSMHNRGLAVDLTVIDREGRELDMGTAYDAFSERSYHDYRGLSDEVKANRAALREAMTAAGFRPLRSEWWHYSLKGAQRPLDDFVWTCTGPWPAGPRYWERRG
ncbi:MAG: M15 family metallopeptidase [Nannocystaceae bacterium]